MGCQRSGTTMLASQLGKAKNAIAFPEMEFVHQLISPAYRIKYSAEEAYENLICSFRFKASGLQISFAQFSEHYDKKDLSLLVRKLVEVNSEQVGAKDTLIWVEHNPQNRDKVHELKDYFPDAKFIHIVRDPRAIYWSMKSNKRWNFGEPTAFAAFWNQAVGQGYHYAKEYSDDCIEVVYENFVTNTEEELMRICSFLDLTYSKEMLMGGGVKLPEFTKYQHAFTEKPADPSRLTIWKSNITTFEDEYISSRCYDWMYYYDYLGRERQDRVLSWSERVGCFVSMVKSDVVSRLVTKYQNWKSTS